METGTSSKPAAATVDGAVIPSKAKGKPGSFADELRAGMGLPTAAEIAQRLKQGLEAFSAKAAESKRETRKIRVTDLRASPTNPRKTFVGLEELGASMVANGVIQALVVRPWVDPITKVPDAKYYEVVCGERRYRAAKLKGIIDLPCEVREGLPDSVVADMQVAENLQRAGLTPIEEAEGFEALMKRFHMTADQVAEKHGITDGKKISGSTVRGRCKLLALGPEGRAAVAEGWLPHSAGTVLARSCPTHAMQAAWLKANRREDWQEPGKTQVINARHAIENLQEEYTHNLGKAPFNIKDEDLVPGDDKTPAPGSCLKCPYNAANMERGLFEDLGAKPGNICTNDPCYRTKCDAAAAVKIAKLEEQGVEVLRGDAAAKALGYSSGLSELGAKNYQHPKAATWGEILEKLPADSKPEIVAVAKPDGEVVQLVDTKAITKAVAKASGAKWAKGEADSAERRKKENAKRKENEKDMAKRGKITATLAHAIGRAAKAVDLELWRMIADKLVRDGSLSDSQLEALGFPMTGKVEPIDALLEVIEKKGTVDQVRALVVAIVVLESEVAQEFISDDDDAKLRALGKRYGVNVADIFTAFENAEKAEALMAGKGKAKK